MLSGTSSTSHNDRLTLELEKLQMDSSTESPVQTATSVENNGSAPESSVTQHSGRGTPRIHEGYGFRPVSGSASPLTGAATTSVLVPDPNGLGWPG